MKNDEIPDLLELEFGLAVKFVDFDLLDTVVREVLDESANPDLNQVDTGGLEWLEEPTSQPKSDAVLVPL